MTLLYVLLALLVFGILVLVHELGHFLVAKAFGVGVREFSIGMGPPIFSWKGKRRWNDKKTDAEPDADVPETDAVPEGNPENEEAEECVTVYSLRSIPIGGYVSMIGEDEESDSDASFEKKNVWKRIAIVLAGPVMNLLLGFILMLVLVLCTTHPDTGKTVLLSNQIGGFQEGSVSHEYLQIGDEVIRVNGVPVHTGNGLIYEIMNQGYEPLDLVVIRDGQRVQLDDVVFPGMTEQGIQFGNADFKVYAERVTFGSVIKHTVYRSFSTVKMIFDQLIDLLTGRFGLKAVSGPVGVTEAMGNAAKDGFSTFLNLIVIITVNLGVFNLLPIPALDGGRLLFLLAEAIARRPLNKKIEGYINAGGLAVLFFIMIVVTCKDIVGLFIK